MAEAFPINVPKFVQNLLFGAGELQILQGGYNSDVLLVSHARQIIIKVIGGKKGVQLTLETASQLGQQVARYRSKLQKLGVKVPGFLEWAVSQEQDAGQVYLFITEPFGGQNPHFYLRNGNVSDRLAIARQILDATEPFLEHACNNAGEANVGLDPKTNNFVFNSDGCTYVDFMPPRYRQDDGTLLVEFPNLTDPSQLDLWKWKYFSAEGVANIALYQLGRLCPEHFQELKKMAFTWMSERGYVRPLQYLQWLACMTPEEIRGRTNPYELRFLMCELASREFHRIGHHGVEEFFLRTHFEGELPADTLNWAQNRLLGLTNAVMVH